MSHNHILSLLGLCLRGGNLTIGEEPVEAVVRARDARVLLLASDAAESTRRRTRHFADVGQCLWLPVPFTKAELGQAVGRSAVAIVAITDIGLASAVVHKLAEQDPVHYDEAAAKLDLKAKRAAERKAEQKAHEKNVRTGKRKKDPPAQQPEAAKKPPAKKSVPLTEKSASRRTASGKSRPSKENRPKSRAKPNPYAHSRPVKKGKGSFRKKEG